RGGRAWSTARSCCSIFSPRWECRMCPPSSSGRSSPRCAGCALVHDDARPMTRGTITASIAPDLRLARSARPLTTHWQHLPVVPRGSPLLGISFRAPQVDAMQLHPRRSLQTLLDYPFLLLRLGAYWNRIELAPDRLVFDELDWQVEAAERAGKQLI